MTDNSDIDDFFTSINSAGFFKRLFSWKKIKSRAENVRRHLFKIAAENDYYKNELSELKAKQAAAEEDKNQIVIENVVLNNKFSESERKYDELKSNYEILSKNSAAQRETFESRYLNAKEEFSKVKSDMFAENEVLNEKFSESEKKYAYLKIEYEKVLETNSGLREKLAAEESIRDKRRQDYERKAETLTSIHSQLQEQLNAIAEKEKTDIEEHHKMLESSWQRHETDVYESIRSICKKNNFNWCDKKSYPNSGTPDNAVIIGGLYTIFDAKSPKNPEELENFPQYIKSQAEGMKKYCKFENVRKDAFLVVPQNAMSVLTDFFYSLAECNVYVISVEAVLPILKILSFIDDYEFAGTLSPEDRDKICRFIGKLSHTAKRKIEIETYLSHEMIDALNDSSKLPEDFSVSIEKYEKSSILNPPMEKRAKMISLDKVENDLKRAENEIARWRINEDVKKDD